MLKVLATGFVVALVPGVWCDGTGDGTGEMLTPAATPLIEATPDAPRGVCHFEGTEYASRWALKVEDKDVAFKDVPEAADCAKHCVDDPDCRGATFWAGREEGKSNCWLKTWEGETAAKPCIPGPDGELSALVVYEDGEDCAQLVWKKMEQFKCEEEPEGPETTAEIEDGDKPMQTTAAAPV